MTKLETEFTSELLAALEQAETITGIGEARLAETARSRGGDEEADFCLKTLLESGAFSL